LIVALRFERGDPVVQLGCARVGSVELVVSGSDHQSDRCRAEQPDARRRSENSLDQTLRSRKDPTHAVRNDLLDVKLDRYQIGYQRTDSASSFLRVLSGPPQVTR
jgi:hypothetical protein